MTECASAITEVCVYPAQVRVVRRGRVDLATDSGEVLLPDLPLSLQPESIRVSGRGRAEVRLLGVEVGKTHYARPPEEALAELDAQIERMEDKDSALAGRVEALSRHLGVLAGLGEASAERIPWGLSRGTLEVAGLEVLLAFLHQDEVQAREQVLQLEVERRELHRELERLRNLRQDRAQPYSPDRYTVRVPVEISQPGEFEFELTYVCQDAFWKPLYDLRFDEKADQGPRVALSQLAEVVQRTGEDWTKVQLSVSTARPALTARLPELDPWYIDMARPPSPPTRRSPGVMVRAAAQPTPGALDLQIEDAMAGEEREEEQAAKVAQAEVREEGPAVSFVAPGFPSIPTDGSPHKVFLGAHDLPAHVDWITAPKVEQHVYRRARVENAAPAVLLPGQASVFHGDTFIGTSEMPETPPKAEFEVYLGADDRIKVERELVQREVDKSGLLEKVRRILFSYRISLRNYHDERIPLTVLDQIPVGRHEALKVKLLRCNPEVEPGDLGELRWEFDLAADEEREITFAFQVEMPLAGKVVGLG